MTLNDLGPGAAVLAFDVGGTDIKAALVDRDGALRGLNRTPTPGHGPQAAEIVTSRLAELAAELRHRFPEVAAAAAGVTAPGIVDEAEGIGVFSSNLGWRNAPVRALAEAALRVPVAFSHDVRAAGTIELRLGAARPFTDSIVIIIGTGISATLIVDGRPHLAHGYAGELGHACVDPHGQRCGCGARGCLETVASAAAIARRYTALGGASVAGARDVVQRATAGDPLAQVVWREAIDALALGIAQATAAIAPEAVVLGGGLAQAGEALLLPLQERLDTLLSFHRRPLLLLGDGGENAGLLGAALLARDLLTGMAGSQVAA